MRRARGMNNQRLRIAYVREVREELDMLDQALACFQSALDAEAQDGTVAVCVVLLRQLVLRMAHEARIADPAHRRMGFEELGDALRVLTVALHAQWQRLQALQEEPGIERSRRRSQVTQQLDTRLDDIRQGSECLDITHTMIGRVWLDQPRKATASGPVELAAIDDDATDRGAMPANELRRRMHDDIGSMLERLQQVRRGQRIVND